MFNQSKASWVTSLTPCNGSYPVVPSERVSCLASDSIVKETITTVLLLQDENKGHFVDGVVFEHAGVTIIDDLLSLVDSNDFKGVEQV